MLQLLLIKVFAFSVDCPNLRNLASGLGMQSGNPTIWTQLQGDCCTADGVVCVSQGVTEISWVNIILYGMINGTAIPNGITRLILWDNQLTGSIPSIFPGGLKILDLNYNRLTGSIPSTLPSGLTHFYLDGNQLSGDLPIFPISLQLLYLGYPGNPGNYFTGTLRLNQPNEVYINFNWITDVIIQDRSQINPSQCDLSNNPLLGNPNIALLTMCAKNGLYSASLLPNTLTTIKTTTSTRFMTTTRQVVTTMTRLITRINVASTMGSTTTTVTVGTTTIQLSKIVTETNSRSTLQAFFSSAITSILSNHILSSSSSSISLSTQIAQTEEEISSFPIQFNTAKDNCTSLLIFLNGTIILNPLTEYQLIATIIRLLVNMLLFRNVINRTPFKREWKSKVHRKEASGATEEV